MAKKTRLSKLKVDEISLVDNPANPAARALIAKRQDEEDVEDVDKMCKGPHKKGEKCKSCGYIMKAADELDVYSEALAESIDSILGDEDVEDKAAEITKSVEQFRSAVLKNLTDQGEPMAEKNESFLKNLTPEHKAELDAFVQKAVETGIAALAKKAEDTEKKAQEIEKKAQDIEKRNNELSAEIAKRDRIQKAKSMVGELPIDVEKFATVLEKIGTNEEVEKFMADLIGKYKAAVTAGSLFHEVGSIARNEQVDANSAEGKVEKRVEEIRKADPKVTYEAAYAKAITEMPELYEESIDDNDAE